MNDAPCRGVIWCRETINCVAQRDCSYRVDLHAYFRGNRCLPSPK